MTATYDTLDVETDGDTVTITIDCPGSLNSVSTHVVEELDSAVRAARRDARVIVLTGAGDKAFISGGDLDEFRSKSAIWFQDEFRGALRRLEDAIENSRVPVVAAVNGVALGGGTEISMMCDMVFAAESAKFGQPEIGLGLIPGAGGTQRLTHLVGYLKAKELVLTGSHVPAAEAVDIGLANDVYPDDEFYDRVYETAESLAEGPQHAQWFAKEAVNRARGDLKQGLELEAALAAILFETDDVKEGLAAFSEKREPDFE